MTRETRANLLFLGIFLAISLPGGVILFKKKLDPSLRPSYLPPAVSTRLPYNDPREGGGRERYVPPITGRWVAVQARALGYANVLNREGLPVMSRGRLVQLMGVEPGGSGTTLSLLVWAEAPGAAVVTAEQDGSTYTGRGVEKTVVEIPAEVRKELTAAGFAHPPTRATWLSVHLPGLTDVTRPATVAIETAAGCDSVNLFTN